MEGVAGDVEGLGRQQGSQFEADPQKAMKAA